jgi:hypothetical protein
MVRRFAAAFAPPDSLGCHAACIPHSGRQHSAPFEKSRAKTLALMSKFTLFQFLFGQWEHFCSVANTS